MFQAISKRWGTLNIPVQYEYILERTYALAHLPADKMDEGFHHIDNLIRDVYDTNEAVGAKLNSFGSYLRRFWKPLKNIMSVHLNPVRTNNVCENFHLHFAKKVGNRPNVWRFLGTAEFKIFI